MVPINCWHEAAVIPGKIYTNSLNLYSAYNGGSRRITNNIDYLDIHPSCFAVWVPHNSGLVGCRMELHCMLQEQWAPRQHKWVTTTNMDKAIIIDGKQFIHNVMDILVLIWRDSRVTTNTQGANTFRHLWYQSHGLYLHAGMCDMCQHLKNCRHQGRCRHVPTPVILIIWTFFIWKLAYAGMCQHLKTCWHLGKCRHVPTHLGADTCRNLWYQSYGLNLDAGMCWHVSAPEKVPTHGSTSQFPNKKSTWLSTLMVPHMPAHVGTFPGVSTIPGADICQYIPASN